MWRVRTGTSASGERSAYDGAGQLRRHGGAAPPSVRALHARAAKADATAFAALVREYDRPLRELAYRLLDDHQRMDDVLQEAYAKAFRSLPRFRGESALGTWLYRIVYNTCLDDLRRQRRTAAREQPVAEAPPTGAPSTRASSSRSRRRSRRRCARCRVGAGGRAARRRARARLPRGIVRPGVPRGTVASRLNRARAALRSALAAAEGRG